MESQIRRGFLVAIILLLLPVFSYAQSEEKFNNDARSNVGDAAKTSKGNDASTLTRNEPLTPDEYCSDYFGKKTKGYKNCVQQVERAIRRK
jgi:hypothetical protein